MQTSIQPAEPVSGGRVAAVDYTKAFAIFWVIVIHVSSDILLSGEPGGRMWLEGLFWGSIARGAVPMFLMCSGVLFLDKKDGLSIRHIWKRNLPHILTAVLAWAISQLFYFVCRRIPWVRRWVI